jgi:hypothetical protein
VAFAIPAAVDHLRHVIGIEPPDADEDALRRCAVAWHRAAGELRVLVPDGVAIAATVMEGLEGATREAFDEAWRPFAVEDGLLEKIALACDQLAYACEDAARQVELARLAYVLALTTLAGTIAVLIAVAAAGGAPTLAIPLAIATAQATVATIHEKLAVVMVAVAALARDAVTQVGHGLDAIGLDAIGLDVDLSRLLTAGELGLAAVLGALGLTSPGGPNGGGPGNYRPQTTDIGHFGDLGPLPPLFAPGGDPLGDPSPEPVGGPVLTGHAGPGTGTDPVIRVDPPPRPVIALPVPTAPAPGPMAPVPGPAIPGPVVPGPALPGTSAPSNPRIPSSPPASPIPSMPGPSPAVPAPAVAFPPAASPVIGTPVPTPVPTSVSPGPLATGAVAPTAPGMMVAVVPVGSRPGAVASSVVSRAPDRCTDEQAVALVRAAMFTTPAGYAFHPPGDENREAARWLTATPGQVVLDVVGSADAVAIGPVALTPAQFATALGELEWTGELVIPLAATVALLASAARVGDRSLAAELARRWGRPVALPDQPVWVAPNQPAVVASAQFAVGNFVPVDPPDGGWVLPGAVSYGRPGT